MWKKLKLLSIPYNWLFEINLSQILFIEKTFKSISKKIFGSIICNPVKILIKGLPYLPLSTTFF